MAYDGHNPDHKNKGGRSSQERYSEQGQESLGKIKESCEHRWPWAYDVKDINCSCIPIAVFADINPFQNLSQKIGWR